MDYEGTNNSNEMSWHTPSTDLGTHICIKLINLVKQYPMIYRSSKESSAYPRKNRTEINHIWRIIARDIGLSVEDCKRRWKGLKDVCAKIRKRRLQEGVLGIGVRKKWLYEDLMSFMNFPFEKSYQKALENIQEVDCQEWKMENNVESNDTGEEALNDSDDHTMSSDKKLTKDHLKTEDPDEIGDETIEYLDLDLEVDSVPDTEGYDQIQSSERDENPLESTVLVKDSTRKKNPGQSAEVQPRSRYRAIRPKPYQPNQMGKTRTVRSSNAAMRNNRSSITPIVNLSNLSPLNQIIVASPAVRRGENRNAMKLSSPDIRVKNYGREASDGVSSTSAAMMKKQSLVGLNRNGSPFNLSVKKSSVSGTELFFQSMAHTVMNLPMRAQAELKMEICKLVTKAEIEYSQSQSSSNLESHKSKSKKG